LLLVGAGAAAFLANAASGYSKVEPLLGHRWRVVHVKHASDYSFSVGRSYQAGLHFGNNRVLDAEDDSYSIRVGITPVEAGYRSLNSSDFALGLVGAKAREVETTLRHVADPHNVTRVKKISAHRFRLTSGRFQLVCVLTHAKPSPPSPHPSSPAG
jgi:hypothetical protein